MSRRKAVFLDRDGVINTDRGTYTFRPEDFIVADTVWEALQAIAAKGYDLVVISNQAGIARGRYTHRDVAAVHALLAGMAAEHGLSFLEIYYCPHYTELGRCICRKPDSLLVEKALARFRIDPVLSYLVGDQDRDLEAAARAGVQGLRVPTNGDLRTVVPLIR